MTDGLGAPRRPLFTTQYILLIATTMTFFGSMYFMLPVLPRYAVLLGADPAAVGLVTGAFTITALLARPYAGGLSDRVGRKPLFLGGSLVFTLAPVTYILVDSISLLLFARAFHGIGIALFTIGAMALVADIVPEERRGEGMSIYGLAALLGMAVAPPLSEPLVAAIGFQGVFLIATATAGISLVTGLLVEEKSRGGPRRRSPGFFATARGRWLILPSVVLAASSVTFGAILSFLPLFTEERQAGNAGLFFAVYALTTTLTRIPIGRLSDRVGRVRIIIPALVVLTLSMVALSAVNSTLGLVLVAILYGASFGTMLPIITALVVDRAPDHNRGTALGVVTASFDLGIGLGSVALGVVGALAGFTSMFLLAGLVTFFGALAFYFFDARHQPTA
jgi:MFS family permease